MSEQAKVEQTIVKIDPDLHRKLKITAARTGRSMREIATEAIAVYLSTRKPAA